MTNYTKAGGGCSSCHEGIENILTEELEARGEVFVHAPTKSKKPAKKQDGLVTLETPAAEPAPAASGMTPFQRIKKIEAVIDQIRPNLQADRGDCELLDVDGKNIYINLVGACSGCQMAAMTVGGIQQKLIEALGEFVKVIPTDKATLAQQQASA